MGIRPPPQAKHPIQPFIPISVMDDTALYSHVELDRLSRADARNELDELSEPLRFEKAAFKPHLSLTRRACVNRIQVAYTDEGQGIPLVFIHGFPLNRHAWVKQVEVFQRQYRVLAPDLRGMGESDSSTGPSPMRRFAGDLHAFLKQLGTGPIVLIGHSMGGYVALAFAKAFPEALSRLVLVGTKASADTPSVAASRRATADRVSAEGTQVVLDAMAPKMLSSAVTDAGKTEAVRSMMAGSQSEGLVGALLGMADRPDASPWLQDIRIPTLIIVGAEDALIPIREAQAMARTLPDAQLKIIPQAGHLVAFDQPEAFNAALDEWLQSTTHRSALPSQPMETPSCEPLDP